MGLLQGIWNKIIIYISTANTTYHIRSAIVDMAKIILTSSPPRVSIEGT